jgi:hypothetical protein
MTLDQRKKLLLDFKLSSDDFYVRTDEFGDKILLRRTGIDKVQEIVKMSFTVESIQTVPYGDKICTTILGKGMLKDGDVARTTASANPDNCDHPHFAEVAEKRCRHRLLLQLARLYQHDIYSEIESNKWTDSRNKFGSAVDNVEKMLKVR